MGRWYKVHGICEVELKVEDGKVYDWDGNRIECLDGEIKNEKSNYEMLIHFFSSGSHEPTTYYSEGGRFEEREFDSVEIIETTDNQIRKIRLLDPLLGEQLYNSYKMLVERTEVLIEEDYPDEPYYWDNLLNEKLRGLDDWNY